MKLSDYKQTYFQCSQTASDVARYSAYAGIAVVWVFKVEGTPTQPATIPTGLLFPIFLFAAGLGLDLLQYLLASLTWQLFYEYHERKLSNPAVQDPVLAHPNWLVRPFDALFYAKFLAIILGYVLIARFLWWAWRPLGN